MGQGGEWLAFRGFQDAAHAVNQAKKYIDPKAEGRAMVSSHNDRLDNHNQKFRHKTSTLSRKQGDDISHIN
ncbi:hypothetical protein [Halobacillus campisalis]|uniref:Uncharacterized protein n=1 Tax=Halobacillus campisalis TaxID=435909 RepID=A0ABW2K585_9BACI|nr:hypothetical protein [Halobacillus campisalis]